VTPVRSLLEELPARVDVALIHRASSPAELVLSEELAELVARRGGALHELTGPREHVALDPVALRRLVPDVAERDVYVCGPGAFNALIERSALAAGVPRDRVHAESFAF
jgi:ferredoxin-NADP reductase